MKRALIDRSEQIKDLPDEYTKTQPHLLQSTMLFNDSKLAKTGSLQEFTDNETDNEHLKASSNCK